MKNLHADYVTAEMVPHLRKWLLDKGIQSNDVVFATTQDGFQTVRIELFRRDSAGSVLSETVQLPLNDGTGAFRTVNRAVTWTHTINPADVPAKVRGYWRKGPPRNAASDIIRHSEDEVTGTN